MPSALLGQGIYREEGALLGGGLYRPSKSAASGGLRTRAHPDYALAYAGDTLFYVDDDPPLKWSLTRQDGATPAVPTAATIRVWNSLGVLVATLTPDLDPAPPAGSRVLAALWPITLAGTYLTQIQLTMPTDGQVRSARQVLLVL